MNTFNELRLVSMENVHNDFGLFYVDKTGQKYLYRTYGSLDALYFAIEYDEDFNAIEKKQVIVIKLEDEYANNS